MAPPNTSPPNRTARFNQLVGNRVGRPAAPNRYSTPAAQKERKKRAAAGVGQSAIGTNIITGGGKISSEARKTLKSWYGTSAPDPYAGSVKAFDKIYNNLSDELNNQIREQNATKTAYASQVLNKQVDPNNPMAITRAPSIDEQYLGGNLQKYVTTPLARAGSVIPRALIANVNAGYDARDQGKGYWAQTLEGLKAGLGEAGKDIREIPLGSENENLQGGGDIYEAVKNRGQTPFSTGARALEKSHPFIEQQASRAAGGFLDWELHPLGKMIGGAKAGVVEGKLATPESIRAHAENLAARWAADAENQVITGAAKAPGGYRPFPTEAAMADHFEKTLTDFYKTAELQVNGGGSRGRYEILNPRMTADMAGQLGAQSLQDSLTSLFRDRVQRLVDGMTGRGQKLNGPAIDQWAALNPDFTEFMSDLTDHLINEGHIPANASSDVVANYLSHADVDTVRNLEQGVIDRKYTPYVSQAANDIAREFRNSHYNAPAIRIGSKVIPVKALGKAFSTIESKFFDDIGKNFRYNSVFPGSLSLDTTKARAWGVRATEDFEKRIRLLAEPFSQADGVTIQHAIENNRIHTLPPEMQTAAHAIVDEYKQMYGDEFTFGARGRQRGSAPGQQSSTTPYDPNYTFVHNKGGAAEDRGRWKRNRKETIHANVRAGNGEGAGRFKTANAKNANFRPVENAFEAVRQRRIKYNRDMIRARFLNDMVDKYGIVSRINPTGKGFAAEERGLERVNFHKLPESMRVHLETTGEDVFLPKSMAQMVNTFDDITKWNTGAQGRIARSFATVMRHIKKAMTLPWPGFHNKNMIGDIFMGLLDHILPKDYALVIEKGMASLRGRNAVFKILKKERGLDIGFRDMWHKYQSEANSGFISSELGTLENKNVKFGLPRKVGGKLESIATGASSFREDSGRFTHYVTAYKQEAEALWRKGERDLSAIDQKASSAALWRVNNYKFDYNALMLWEKKTKTLAFPFYTFIRKAAPTLMQALYQDPRWISSWTRYMYQHQLPDGQDSAGGFDGFRVPSDIRDAGYAFIGGNDDAPEYVSNDILPTSVFNSVKTKNAHEFFNSVLSQAALPYQVAVEQGTGQQTFLDRPLQDQSFGDYLFSKVPGTREFGQFFDSKKPWSERLLTSRLGAGLPIKTLNENQQLFALQEWQDRMVDNPLKKVNSSQDLFYISRQVAPDGKAEIFTVKNNQVRDQNNNATDVASFYTPEDAIQYVKKHLPDAYKKIPLTWDLNNQGNPVQRPVNTGG